MAVGSDGLGGHLGVLTPVVVSFLQFFPRS